MSTTRHCSEERCRPCGGKFFVIPCLLALAAVAFTWAATFSCGFYSVTTTPWSWHSSSASRIHDDSNVQKVRVGLWSTEVRLHGEVDLLCRTIGRDSRRRTIANNRRFHSLTDPLALISFLVSFLSIVFVLGSPPDFEQVQRLEGYGILRSLRRKGFGFADAICSLHELHLLLRRFASFRFAVVQSRLLLLLLFRCPTTAASSSRSKSAPAASRFALLLADASGDLLFARCCRSPVPRVHAVRHLPRCDCMQSGIRRSLFDYRGCTLVLRGWINFALGGEATRPRR